MSFVCVDDVLSMELARVSLGFQSVMTHMYWLPWFVYGNCRSISIAMNSRGQHSRKSCIGCLGRYQLTCYAHLSHLEIVVKMLLAMSGKEYVCLNVSYIRRCHGPCHRAMICRVQNTHSKQVWCYSLDRLIYYLLSNKKTPFVATKLRSSTAKVELCWLVVVVKRLLDY